MNVEKANSEHIATYKVRAIIKTDDDKENSTSEIVTAGSVAAAYTVSIAAVQDGGNSTPKIDGITKLYDNKGKISK